MSDDLSTDLRFVEEKFGYRFRDPRLLERALTHSSFANERGRGEYHNERQEFLGDAALELCVSSRLFTLFPDAREGELTRTRARMVSGENLFNLARKLGLDKFIKLGQGEEKQGGRSRESVVSDALEAVLGAIYEDGGYEAARRSVDKIFSDQWPARPVGSQIRDNKSVLQEICQRVFHTVPVYALVDSSGEEHSKIYEVSVRLPDGRVFVASATSRKKAERGAAGVALDALKNESP